jgi:hypothetical protein
MRETEVREVTFVFSVIDHINCVTDKTNCYGQNYRHAGTGCVTGILKIAFTLFQVFLSGINIVITGNIQKYMFRTSI